MSSTFTGYCIVLYCNSKGRVDEVIRVKHPLTYDQEFLIFIFAFQREREEGPPDRRLKNDNPEVNKQNLTNRRNIGASS